MTREEIEAKYNKEFQKLSGRSKNFLDDLGLNKFYTFYQDILVGGVQIEFRKLRNCGVKTEAELRCFFEKFPQEKENIGNRFHEEIMSNWLLQQNFHQLVNRQNQGVKKCLKNLGIKTLQDFSHRFLSYPDGSTKYLFLVIPCHHQKEFLLFRDKILRYHGKTKHLIQSGNVFSLLHYFLIESKKYQDVEWELFTRYYKFLIGFNSLTIQEIADKTKLTKERIRQISLELLENIETDINILSEKIQIDLPQYLFGDVYAITSEIETSINKKEKTGFSKMFITYVLSNLIKGTDFYFLNTSTQRNHITGVFIRKGLNFSFEAFFKDIEKITRSPKKKFHRIPINDIFQKYGFIRKVSYDINKDYEEKVLDVIYTLLNSIPKKIEYKIQYGNFLIRRFSDK